MLRIIVKTDDSGMAANIGGSTLSDLKSFDVELPEVEAFLREYEKAVADARASNTHCWWHRQVIGIEVK